MRTERRRETEHHGEPEQVQEGSREHREHRTKRHPARRILGEDVCWTLVGRAAAVCGDRREQHDDWLALRACDEARRGRHRAASTRYRHTDAQGGAGSEQQQQREDEAAVHHRRMLRVPRVPYSVSFDFA